MAWIESHQELGRHPKTRRAARLLKTSVPGIIGHLHLLWHWCLDYAQDGDLTRIDPMDIADALMWDGEPDTLIDGLAQAGFLDRDGKTLTVHDWYLYGGRLIEKRRIDAERKRAERGHTKDAKPASNGRPTDVSGNSTVHNTTVQDTTNNNTNAAANAGDAPPIHDQSRIEEIYQAYPRKEGKAKALKAIAKARDDVKRGKVKPDDYDEVWPPPDTYSFLLDRVQRYAAYASGLSAHDRQFIPHPATWFNAGSYLDSPKRIGNQNGNHPTNSQPARVRHDDAMLRRFMASRERVASRTP